MDRGVAAAPLSSRGTRELSREYTARSHGGLGIPNKSSAYGRALALACGAGFGSLALAGGVESIEAPQEGA